MTRMLTDWLWQKSKTGEINFVCVMKNRQNAIFSNNRFLGRVSPCGSFAGNYICFYNKPLVRGQFADPKVRGSYP